MEAVGEARQTTKYSQHIKELEKTGYLEKMDPVYTPYEHQKLGFDLMMKMPRMGVFWEPGLGKTYVTCHRIMFLRDKYPKSLSVVLALRVNLSTWEREMEVHSRGEEEIRCITGSNPKIRKKRLLKAVEDGIAGIVITYESARSSLEDLLKLKIDLIVADECHKLRNYNSGITKAALALSKKCSYRYVVTGTPTTGKPTDIWGALRFLGDFVVEPHYPFKRKHVITSRWNPHIVTGYRNLGRINKLVHSIGHVVKSEEAVDVPPRTFMLVRIAPKAVQRSIYNKIVHTKDDEIIIKKEEILLQPSVVKLSKLAQLSAGFIYKSLKDPTICDTCPKLKACFSAEIKPYTKACTVAQKDPGRKVIHIPSNLIQQTAELCVSHIKSGKKVILWAKHQETISLLYEKCVEEGLIVFRYDSTMTSPGEVERAFNTSTNPCVIVAQVSMGIGVTFKGSIMVYAELPFALDQWLQSLDRNWGIRAKGLGKILVQTVVIKGSVYEDVYKLLQSKVDVASLMVDRPVCTSCPQVLTCINKNIVPFKRGCIYPSSVKKTSIDLGRYI